MSLKAFHIFFITISTLSLVGFAVWLFASDAVESVFIQVIGGIVTITAAVGLVFYGRWFLAKYKNVSNV